MLLISAPLNAEPGTDATDSEDDLALRTRDTNDVVRMRKFLESKYLGNIHLGPGQNEPMREYINWLMEPLESLVFKKQLMTRLRLKQLGGPTGVAKTQVARDFMEMAKKFKLILPNRADYRQGDANTKIDLAIVEKLQIAEKDLQSAGNTNGYGNVKARHLQTYALLFLDEFSHNAVPAKDLTELTENFGTQLRSIRSALTRLRSAMATSCAFSRPRVMRPDR